MQNHKMEFFFHFYIPQYSLTHFKALSNTAFTLSLSLFLNPFTAAVPLLLQKVIH